MVTWAEAEPEVRAAFGWPEADDRASAEALRSLLHRDAWRDVGTELKHRPDVAVVGCGPGLEHLTPGDLPPGVVVAADGATERLREIGVLPRVVVTDLDGDPDALQWAAAQGASMVVHAHGDNRDRIETLVPGFGPLVAGTCQVDPAGLAPLRNLGGLTDGDRAVLLCEAYRVRRVRLVAFDLDAAPSRYSHHWDPATKAAKLAWARRFIHGVHERGVTRVEQWVPT